MSNTSFEAVRVALHRQSISLVTAVETFEKSLLNLVTEIEDQRRDNIKPFSSQFTRGRFPPRRRRNDIHRSLSRKEVLLRKHAPIQVVLSVIPTN